MEVPQQSLGYSFPVIIYRLRVVQLIALVLQVPSIKYIFK